MAEERKSSQDSDERKQGSRWLGNGDDEAAELTKTDVTNAMYIRGGEIWFDVATNNLVILTQKGTNWLLRLWSELLRCGADPRLSDSEGKSARDCASERRHGDVEELLK